MAHDFFRDADERPEALKNEDKAEKFQSTDMIQESPDLFKKEEEPKAEKAEETVEEVGKVEEKPAEEVVEKATEEDKKIKELTAIYEGKEYKIPVEARFKQQVDNEDVDVSIQDLRNNYSGKQSWDKKYSELDKKSKAQEADFDRVNKFVGEFAEISKQDEVKGLMHLAKVIGLDPLEYKRKLRSQLVNTYGEYLQMDEDQRSVYEQKEELEYLRQQKETDTRLRSEEQAHEDLNRQFFQIQQTHGIDDDRLNFLAKELQDGHNAEITPQNVATLHNSYVRLDRVDNVLKQVNESLLDDDQKVLQLESLLQGKPDMTDEDLKGIAIKLWGDDVEKAVANLEKRAVDTEVLKAPEKPHTFTSKLNHAGSSMNFFE